MTFGYFCCGSDTYVNLVFSTWFTETFILASNSSWRGASDSVTDSSVLSNPADAQNISCLGLCGRDICLKSSA